MYIYILYNIHHILSNM